MRALERVARDALDIADPIGSILDPDTCPARFLPFLAWHLSVDVWRNEWPEHIQRARIKASMSVHRPKGTAAAVRDVVASFGGALLLREWFEMDGAPPGTFEIVMSVSGDGGYTSSSAFVDDIIAEVIRTKPVSAHFTFTQGANVNASLGIAIGISAATYHSISVTALDTP